MSMLSIVHSSLNVKKIENGILWSGVFGLSTLPVYYYVDRHVIPKLSDEYVFKQLASSESLKLLLGISTLVGFFYGYNTQRRLSN